MELDYAQARYYSPMQGRFTSVDPLMASGSISSPQTWNRYSYCYNNPLRFTDPSGMIAGDFYNEKGKYLGTDGINDGNIYVVTESKQADQIAQANKQGGTTQVSAVSSAVLLPRLAVRQAVGAAVMRSNSPTTDDKQGGFHEEGLMAGPLVAGGQEQVVDAAPGAFSDPRVEGRARIDVTNPVNPAQSGILADITVTAHVHPKGELPVSPTNAPGSVRIGGSSGTYGFVQPPSAADRQFAAGLPNATHIVAGARNNTVYIYNGAGIRATFPLNKFTTVVGGRR